MEEFLSGILESSSLPFVTALILGLMTAISPAFGDQHYSHRVYWQGYGEPEPGIL